MIRIASLWVNEDKTVTDGIFRMVAVTSAKWTHELRVEETTVARLWKSDKADKTGNAYYSGSFGKERDLKCLVFRNNSDTPNIQPMNLTLAQVQEMYHELKALRREVNELKAQMNERTQPEPASEWLTLQEAAALLGYKDVSSVHRICKAGWRSTGTGIVCG